MVTPCMLTDQPPAALAACAARGMSAHCASVSVPAACSTPPAMLLEFLIMIPTRLRKRARGVRACETVSESARAPTGLISRDG
jgi:hypothetical protein